MSVIRKKIENLKPGKQYVLTVRTKNSDINATGQLSDTIRFTVPQDPTVPNAVSNLRLFASFEKVMFIYDFSTDKDVSRYEYELYSDREATDLVLSGFNASNVFTVSVPNSSSTWYGPDADEENPYSYNGLAYWGRVRAIDTSNNAGPWTSLCQVDQETPLIDEQYINSLTASKITAGIIGAHEIVLTQSGPMEGYNPPSGTEGYAVLRSSNYLAGVAGWLIRGDGYAELASAKIRGEIEVGSSASFGVTTHDVVATAPFGPGTFYFLDRPTQLVEGSYVTVTGLEHEELNVTYEPVVAVANNFEEGLFIIYLAVGGDLEASYQQGELQSSGLFIDVDGSLSIGSGDESDPFKVKPNGKLEIGTAPNLFEIFPDGSISIGGDDTTSLHIDKNGNLWTGAATLASGKFRLSNTGTLDIGGGDTTSLHIGSDGRLWAGDADFEDAPFRIQPFDASLSISNITGSRSISSITGDSVQFYSTVGMQDKVIRGTTSFTSGTPEYRTGDNYRFSVGYGLQFRSGTTTELSIGGTSDPEDGGHIYSGGGNTIYMGTAVDEDDPRWGYGVVDGFPVANTPTGTGLLVYSASGALVQEPSSRTVKENIDDFSGEEALSILSMLSPKKFNFKRLESDSDEVAELRKFDRQIGFIAEEVADISKEIGLDIHHSSPPPLPEVPPNPYRNSDLSSLEGLSKREISALDKMAKSAYADHLAAKQKREEIVKDLDSYVPSQWKHPHMIAIAIAACKELVEKVNDLQAQIDSLRSGT